MGSSNRIPVGITFTAGNSSPCKESTAWYQNIGADIIVTDFWGDLKVAVVRVNAVSILPIVNVFRSKILFIKIDWSSFWSKFLVNGLITLELIGFVYFTIALIFVKVSKRRSTDILSVGN